MKSAPGPSGQTENVETADPADRAAFGEFLRHARERRHLTLEQIASDTKISSRHLTALEQGNVKSLPSGMYRRAMLRAYADSVGLDNDAALEQFERTFEPGARAAAPRASAAAAHAGLVQEAAPSAAPVSERKNDVRVSLIGVVIAATAIVALVSGDRSTDTLAAPDAAASTVQPPPSAGTAQPVDAAPPRSNAEADVTAPSRADAAPPAPAQAAASASRSATGPGTPRAGGAADAVTATGGDDVAVEPRPASVRAVAGEIAIVTEPAGARVTIDGTGWGTTPVTVRHLPFGAKRVRVTRDGYGSQERTVSVSPDRPGASLRLTLEPRE
jgi:cytoskeletal protein RodZ